MVTLAVAPAPAMRQAAAEGVPSKDGMVVCTSAPACDAGAAVLAKGGNAVDAAVATAFALAVTHPSAGNIGGGGFMVVRSPNGAVTTFDYREKAPQKSTRAMYMRDGKVDISLTNAGYLAPGVPGTVRGLALAHKRFGRLPWKDVVMPGVQLAEDGFILSDGLARGLNGQVAGAMSKFPASVEAYGKPGGGTWAGGDRIVLKDLGKTLRAIATDGPDAFYKGWIADRIAEDLAANGGLITKADLAAYEAKERAPVKGTFRGYEIASMPPPSSGGVALIEMLNMLEAFDLKAKGFESAEAKHFEIEAMRRAYLDRARFLGDPDFVQIPLTKLLSKDYARTLASTIDPAKASSSAELGKDILTTPATQEPDETTHFSVIDRRHGRQQHLHARRRLRLARRRQGRGLPAEQRDGGLQQEPRRHAAGRHHRHAGQPDRPGQADAQLDDADDRVEGGQGRADHRLARRSHDHQHGVLRRVRGDRVRHERPRRRRRAAHAPPVDAGHGQHRAQPAPPRSCWGSCGRWATRSIPERGPAGRRGTRTRSAWTPAARPGAPATSAAPTARRRWRA